VASTHHVVFIGHGFEERDGPAVTSSSRVLAPPIGWPLDRFGLVLSLEAVRLPVEGSGPASMIFLGGFDQPFVVEDLGRATTALAFLYPPADFELLKTLLPTTDLPRHGG
jgi:hypothetical protein